MEYVHSKDHTHLPPVLKAHPLANQLQHGREIKFVGKLFYDFYVHFLNTLTHSELYYTYRYMFMFMQHQEIRQTYSGELYFPSSDIASVLACLFVLFVCYLLQ